MCFCIPALLTILEKKKKEENTKEKGGMETMEGWENEGKGTAVQVRSQREVRMLYTDN